MRTLKLRRLKSILAVPGFIFGVLLPLFKWLGYISDIDFVLSAGGNPRIVAVWNWLTTPTGNLVLMLTGLSWLALLVWWPSKSSDTSSPATPAAIASQEQNRLEEGRITVEPNLVCTSTAPRPARINHNILVEGFLEPYELATGNVVAIVAEISNEFLPSREVADVEGISAEIIYQPSVGPATKVKRGSWLNEDTYQLDFSVNDAHRLIIAFFSIKQNQPIFIFTRESLRAHDDFELEFENRMGLLESDHYQVKVRLISEAERKLYKEFDFSLSITRKPELDIELVEVRDLSPKEIRHQLELFLGEGSDLLREFPREKQATPEDIAKVDDWEKRAVRFLSRYPDLFSTTLFLSDFPEVPVAGGAQGGNWPSLKKLSRRLATLREFIDELRKGSAA